MNVVTKNILNKSKMTKANLNRMFSTALKQKMEEKIAVR
jgi:hypothetical protein